MFNINQSGRFILPVCSVLSSLILNLFVFQNSAKADDPVVIRITAAQYDLLKNSAPNAGISLETSQEGFDVYWTGYNISSSSGGIYSVLPVLHVLAGSGKSQVASPSGFQCSGNFSVDNNPQNFFFPSIVNNGSVVTLLIPGPAAAGNSGSAALLDDQSGVALACRAPKGAQIVSGTNLHQLVATFTPILSTVPADNITGRSTYAHVQINSTGLPTTIPFTSDYSAVIDTTTTQSVFFGVVTVSRGTDSLQAIDPFKLGGYVPPTNAGDNLNPPPANLGGSTDTPARIGKWLKDFVGPLDKALQNSLKQAQTQTKTRSALSGTGTYDAVHSTFTFSGYPIGLSGGESLSFGIVMRDPSNAPAELKPSVPKNAPQNSIDGPVTVTTNISNAVKKNLRSGKAFAVYVTVKVTPQKGASISRTGMFKLSQKK